MVKLLNSFNQSKMKQPIVIGYNSQSQEDMNKNGRVYERSLFNRKGVGFPFTVGSVVFLRVDLLFR